MTEYNQVQEPTTKGDATTAQSDMGDAKGFIINPGGIIIRNLPPQNPPLPPQDPQQPR